mgnify:CR=1 FL=1
MRSCRRSLLTHSRRAFASLSPLIHSYPLLLPLCCLAVVQTCLRLSEYHTMLDGEPPKVLMWAHNSHVGDARATQMAEYAEWNLGQMVREPPGWLPSMAQHGAA